jgi:uncharacterized membrane protein YhaH (DUF805 family)
LWIEVTLSWLRGGSASHRCSNLTLVLILTQVISSLVVLLLAFAALVMGARRPHTRCLPAWLLPAFYR